MTEPQVWVLIGGFAAAMLGTHTVITTSFTQTLRAETGTDRC